MGNNKNALIRYRRLDSCFRNTGRRYFMADLIAECSEAITAFAETEATVSRRQIYEDLKFMESEAGYQAEIGRYQEGKKTYYRYEDPSFSIDQQPFNAQEINQLQEAVLLLSRFEGIPLFQQTSSILSKLQQGFSSEDFNPLVSFDDNPYLRGLSYFGELFAAIFYKKVLQVEYRNFQGETSHFHFHPYHLKEYRNRWYVIGYHSVQKKTNWLLALDRIQQLQEGVESYREAEDIDWEDYFYHAIGVTIKADQTAEKTLLHFHPKAAPYVKTKPLHGTQKIVSEDEKGLVLSLEILPNFEFYQNILAFGEQVEILAPEHFRHHIKDRLREALSAYQ